MQDAKPVRDAASYVLLPFQKTFMTRIEIAEEELDAGGNSHGFLLLGESGSGKSFIFDRLALQYPPRVEGFQRITPFVRYNARAGADFTSMCRGLLKALGSSSAAVMQLKTHNLEDALRAALIKHQTHIIGLEEVHNGLTNEGKQLRSRLREFLKNLWNFFPDDNTGAAWTSATPGEVQRKLIIIISGTPVLKGIFEEHDEIRTRYNNIIHAGRLSISSPGDFKVFRALLVHFAERFHINLELEPDDDEFCMRCYLATGAGMRCLERLFERAGTLSRQPAATGQRTEQIFSSALNQVDDAFANFFNPFSASLEQLTNEFSMELTRQLAVVKNKRVTQGNSVELTRQTVAVKKKPK